MSTVEAVQAAIHIEEQQGTLHLSRHRLHFDTPPYKVGDGCLVAFSGSAAKLIGGG